MNSYYRQKYIMTFLMGLNDSYAQVRGQILLMEPLPRINKVFSLIIQEERQRKIGSPYWINHCHDVCCQAYVCYCRQTRSEEGRPYCTHCKYHDHTGEKCYKLHGYPPGFKQKQKTPSEGHNSATTNQVATLEDKSTKDNDSIGSFFQNLDTTQCHHPMNLLAKRMTSNFKIEAPVDNISTSHNTGTCFQHLDCRLGCLQAYLH